MNEIREIQLNSAPSDLISSCSFAQNSNRFLLVSSWDGTVRLYDTKNNLLKQKFLHEAPIMDCTFLQDGVHAASGGADKTLRYYDLNTNTESILGTHNATIRCVEMATEMNSILTGSWDSKIKLWDARTKECVNIFENPMGKIHSMSCVYPKLFVSTYDNFYMYDFRYMLDYAIANERFLKNTTRIVRIFPNKDGFVRSTIEGRLRVECYDLQLYNGIDQPGPIDLMKENNIEIIHPVSSISFHSVYNTFATGSYDGMVNFWDGYNKKHLGQLQRFDSSVTALDFSSDGTKLAIACTYLDELEKATKPIPEPAIYVQYVNEQKVKPK